MQRKVEKRQNNLNPKKQLGRMANRCSCRFPFGADQVHLQYLVDLHVVSVEEHCPDVTGAKRAALVHPPALTPGAGLAEVCKLHYLLVARAKKGDKQGRGYINGNAQNSTPKRAPRGGGGGKPRRGVHEKLLRGTNIWGEVVFM